MNENLSFLRDKANRLPLKPGVYQMKDIKGKIIYIGKAKALKNRVTGYFQNVAAHNIKTFKLVENITDFDFIITNSELDALILEATLIKQYSPKYNILLKDDKGFNYIKITAEDYPRLKYSLNQRDKGATYIGPYAATYTIKQTVEDANRIFMLPSCNRKFPRDFGKERPCLNYQIKRCMGVCRGEIDKETYNSHLKEAVEYIKNGSRQSIKRLTAEMEEAAENLHFEKAAKLRDQIKAMTRTESVQKIESKKTTDFDVIGFAENTNLVSVAVIKYRGGRIVDKENFFIGDEGEAEQMRSEFLLEYYSKNPPPREIYIDHEISDKEALEAFFRDKYDKTTHITIPKRGEGLTQVTLAKSNAGEYLLLKVGRAAKEALALEELARTLGLPTPPEIIESYDISNLGEQINVGGMVVYRKGKPYKKGYKKFTIKDVVGQDDYASMSEVLRRRFTRYLAGDESFSLIPDLILIDGGKGHLSAAATVLLELGLSHIPIFGMVKDEKHRTRAIAGSGGEIQINANKKVFSLITNIQDETHRFSISFQQQRHKKKSYEMTLTDVPGIGFGKAAALIKHFKTKQKLLEANSSELKTVAKISNEKADELYQFIQENYK